MSMPSCVLYLLAKRKPKSARKAKKTNVFIFTSLFRKRLQGNIKCARRMNPVENGKG
jgi:hypothetical protein